MLKFKSLGKPGWTWLPETQPAQIYSWTLFRLEEERYWQIAWMEYNRRRRAIEKNYKASSADTAIWQDIGHHLFASLTDPQLFIELLFVNFLSLNQPRPPELHEIAPRLSTLPLWVDENYRPDAEGDLFIAGNNIQSLIQRYPDTTANYWLKEKSSEFPAYFHFLYRSSGDLPTELALKGAKQVMKLSIIRALERLEIWPADAFSRLLHARTHTK